VKRAVLACVVALVVAAGCEQKKEDVPAAPTAQPKPTAELPRPPVGIAPPPAQEKAAAADDDLSTSEEFEEEAEKDIASSNVAAEVDKLEKEIGE
jgi:hypothetical protein